MREIQFRAKRMDTGEWVQSGNLLHFNEGNEIFIPARDSHVVAEVDEKTNIIGLEAMTFFRVHGETVGQYTGLKDLNGTPVYEGDIFEVDKYVPYGYDPPVRGVVKFGRYSDIAGTGTHFGFFVSWNMDLCLRRDIGYWIDRIGTTIIGNIYDNPELMEVKT